MVFNHIFKCFGDYDDCTNADNSCCPYTSWDNIVAINKEYKEDYKEIGEACPEVVLCSEIVIGRQADTKCINNLCTISS